MQTETSSDNEEYNRTKEWILSLSNKNLEIRPYKEVTAQVNMAAIAPQSLSKTCIWLQFSRALDFVDNNAF